MKTRATSLVGRRPQTAIMRLYNGTTDRQAHTAALRFSGEEGIEYLVRVIVRYSDAIIADGDEQLPLLG